MNSLRLNSKSEITNVYNTVIQDVIKNMKDVFKDEKVSQYVLRDLESLWTSKFLKTREPTLPVTLVPMKIMVPFKKSPSSETEIREIELMVPHHEAELLDFNAIFSEGIMNAVIYLSKRPATTFLQQRINTFLVSKDQVERMILLNEVPDELESMEEEDLLDDYVTVEAEPNPLEIEDDYVTMKTRTDTLEQDSLDDFVILKAKPDVAQDPLDDFVIVKAEQDLGQDPLDDFVIVEAEPDVDVATVKMKPVDIVTVKRKPFDVVPVIMEQDDYVTVNTEPDEVINPLDDAITIKEEPLHDLVSIKEDPPIFENAVPQTDGANDTSDDDSSDDSKSSSSQNSKEVEQSIYGSDGESLNSNDDVTDEDVDTLFDCDNLILCQYMKVLRSKNKWRFYFKDGVMNLNGCDYAFHKIFGDATW